MNKSMIEYKTFIREYHAGGNGSTTKHIMEYAPHFIQLEDRHGAKVEMIPADRLAALEAVAEAARDELQISIDSDQRIPHKDCPCRRCTLARKLQALDEVGK